MLACAPGTSKEIGSEYLPLNRWIQEGTGFRHISTGIFQKKLGKGDRLAKDNLSAKAIQGDVQIWSEAQDTNGITYYYVEGTMQSTYIREYLNEGRAYYIDNRIGTPMLDKPIELYRPDVGVGENEVGTGVEDNDEDEMHNEIDEE